MEQGVENEDQPHDINNVESESSQREGDDASAKRPAAGLSRRQKMSAARLERRRAVDRESQRATRARTKAYITQLENNIAAMEQNATHGRTSTLVRQLQEKQEEIDRLNGLVANVRKLLSASIGNGDKTSSDDLANTNLAPSHKNSEASAARLWLSAYDSPSETSSADDSMALCPFSVALKCADGPKNYFRNLNTAVEFIQANGRSTIFAGQDEAVDDDIAIRAVLHGWRAAEEKHDLDLAWQFSRAVDQGLYSRCDPVVRLASIRSIRTSLVHKLQGNNTSKRRNQPGFMKPTEVQKTVKHPSIVDFFVWPQVRDWLINARITFVSEHESSAFADHLRFNWPYELRDVCRGHRETGLYSFSEGFDRAFNDLSNWTIASEFYGVSSMSPLVLQPHCPIMQRLEAQRQLRASQEAGMVVPLDDQSQVQEGNDPGVHWSSSLVRLDGNADNEPGDTDFSFPAAFISSQWPELTDIMDNGNGWVA
ncbi:hypothetical protein B0A52_09053 [Exophiala mesophila]|uniref:BZIP domain-containing protein n=1 Tax=Exophiala mesophila TaxID=212818 RepID=A0A438MTA0_EXOME|nr:hypothetical protein B0A52_09053 [Exophiala mesophila]